MGKAKDRSQHNHPGRFRNNPAAGGTRERILADSLARIGGDGGVDRELVSEAVAEALAGRRPQW